MGFHFALVLFYKSKNETVEVCKRYVNCDGLKSVLRQGKGPYYSCFDCDHDCGWKVQDGNLGTGKRRRKVVEL